MCKYIIEVNQEVNKVLENNARIRDMSIESLIEEILNKYLIPLHTMDKEDMAKGYIESGDINLEIANI